MTRWIASQRSSHSSVLARRFQPLHLRWCHRNAAYSDSAILEMIGCRFPNLISPRLDNGVQWSSAVWQSLLASPLRRTLRGGDCSLNDQLSPADEAVLPQLVQLEHFNTLGLPAESESCLSSFTLLPAAHNLKCLQGGAACISERRHHPHVGGDHSRAVLAASTGVAQSSATDGALPSSALSH